MASHFFVGTWEIVECKPAFSVPGTHVDKLLLEGTVMKLDESGDVTWTIKQNAEDLPLFASDTYDISYDQTNDLIVHFGACGGHVIEFQVIQMNSNFIRMSEIDGWCTLVCKCVNAADVNKISETPFTLLPALEDGYFSDLTITASNSKKFDVHTCIVGLLTPDVDWSQTPPPLSGLPEEVLGTILHYLYAECLPAGLTEATARHCISAVNAYPSFAPFVALCQHYLRNYTLKQQVMNLVNDMHNCASQIIQHFSVKHSPATSESLINNPAKLCFVVRQSIQEAAVAGVKLLVLCDLFSKRKSELTSEQRHEIIRYAKSRLPVFMGQLRRFLVGIKATFSSLSPTQSQEIATYLVPEIEKIFEIISNLGMELKSALEQIASVIFKEGHATTKRRLIMSLKEVNIERFNEMTNVNKVRIVSRSLEQLIEEIPIFIVRLEEITAALDDKLGWRDFKFCFKVGSSKVHDFVKRLVTHKSTLHSIVIQLCDLVSRDSFSQSLVSLGLLDRVPCSPAAPPPPPSAPSSPAPDSPSAAHATPKHNQPKLSLVESLCEPRLSSSSRLSKAALELLRSGVGTDMVFEIRPSHDAQDSAVSSPSTEQASAAAAAASSPPPAEEVLFSLKAHRLIVAARCDWFRRALLSGMREAIDRKIVIIDTSPKLFTILVEYLYSGLLESPAGVSTNHGLLESPTAPSTDHGLLESPTGVNTDHGLLESPTGLSADQLADLLYAADRYQVDSLKTACEQGLTLLIDNETVLDFLSLGDQFNAKLLKSSCLNFISSHPDIMDSELFEELPQNLQTEIYDLMIWGNRRKSEKMNNAQHSGAGLSQLANDFSANLKVSHSHSQEMPANQRMSHSHSQEMPQDSARLEACLTELSGVIGNLATRTELVQLALAADYDLNRALNFFFSS
ncbi:uncharacterized protein LOC111055920 [Nilaparvata lugens]|uniref:uncharacterized protein LOC111055920 n=1 Tax=Nilaparvata lugens TaxID=108931 RepID=UPI00193DB0DE|nr:uncharacterized protein LOC111055920 [Nilaparvata lugens]